MTLSFVNPLTVAPPVGNYSHLAIVPPGKRLLVLAGQVGNRPDGSLTDTFEDQFEQALRNILLIVESQGGVAGDIAKLTFYFAEEPSDRTRIRASLPSVFGETRPTMTMIRVVGLADPKYKLEIDALAAVDG